jgi:hypothetical protein
MPKRPENSEVVPSTSNPQGLGTFGGVFTPSILTILGVIMYLRFGWVLGHVGLWQTLLIVTLSTSITFLTGLSISAIATDQVVRAGGAYYMISRSLGIETGGAVGLPLYFAQALSVALYTLGFAESMVQVFPQFNQTVIALITTIGVTLLALKSAAIAIKTQYFIMAAIALSLVSLVLGHSVEPTTLTPPEAPGTVGFWAVLAVFFPAVTGIMSGVNMSGDLKDPQRSIPIGTMAAVGTGYLIYMLIPLFLNRWADPATLVAEPLVMRRMALWGDAIVLGVWGGDSVQRHRQYSGSPTGAPGISTGWYSAAQSQMAGAGEWSQRRASPGHSVYSGYCSSGGFCGGTQPDCSSINHVFPDYLHGAECLRWAGNVLTKPLLSTDL